MADGHPGAAQRPLLGGARPCTDDHQSGSQNLLLLGAWRHADATWPKGTVFFGGGGFGGGLGGVVWGLLFFGAGGVVLGGFGGGGLEPSSFFGGGGGFGGRGEGVSPPRPFVLGRFCWRSPVGLWSPS